MSAYGYTANLRFTLINYATRGWHTEEWGNWNLVDSLLFAGMGAVPFTATVGGTGDAITLNFTPDITYTSGQQISFTAGAINTGAVTVNCDGLGVKSLASASGAALAAGQIQAGMYVRAIYNGTKFTIIDPGYTGVTTPYVSTGSSGAIAAGDADDFYVESGTNNMGVSLLSPAGYTQRINFGRPLATSAGSVIYDHATDKLTFRTNGTDQVSLDSNGILLAPKQPAFFVYWEAHTATVFAFSADILFPTEVTDVGNNYAPATGKFTAPVSGTYRFRFGFNMQPNAGNLYVDAAFYKNGVRIGPTYPANPYSAFFPPSADSRSFSIEIILVLAASDYVTSRLIRAAGSTDTGNPVFVNTFSGELIG